MNAVAIINQYSPKSPRRSLSSIFESLNNLDWSAPEPRSQGDLQVEELFISVGYALTVWEEMDARLGLLFSVVRGRQKAVSPLPYFYIAKADGTRRDRSLNEKIGLFQQEFKALDPEIRDVFDELSRQLTLASKQRNQIGHGVVRNLSMSRDGEMEYRGNYLLSKEDIIINSATTMNKLTSDQIAILGNRFRDLRGLADDFAAIISEKQK